MISVVIPTLKEAKNLARLYDSECRRTADAKEMAS